VIPGAMAGVEDQNSARRRPVWAREVVGSDKGLTTISFWGLDGGETWPAGAAGGKVAGCPPRFELSAATGFGGGMRCTGIFDGGLRTCVDDWSLSVRSETTSSAVTPSLASGRADAGSARARLGSRMRGEGNEETVWGLGEGHSSSRPAGPPACARGTTALACRNAWPRRALSQAAAACLGVVYGAMVCGAT
jgi:hypothetical protein